MMKVLKVFGRILLAGILLIGHCVMNVIGLIIGAITSQK